MRSPFALLGNPCYYGRVQCELPDPAMAGSPDRSGDEEDQSRPPPGSSGTWLLVSDIDDTLDGDRQALFDFARQWTSLLLVVNSSRPRRSVERTLQQFPRELKIHGSITALGTEISLLGEELSTWSDRFRPWCREEIFQYLRRAGFRPHDEEFQAPYKVSFAVPRPCWAEVGRALRDRFDGLQIVQSGESDFDVIPASAGKGAATLEVARRLEIPPARLVVAGDSGNDLSLFAVSEMAVAVGNARPELREHADPDRTYFARAPRAAGLTEGLRHWMACHINPNNDGDT